MRRGSDSAAGGPNPSRPGGAGAQLRPVPPLEGLRAFEVAARHLNFTEAANELLVTQGAISQRIKSLERELGVTLFDRLARGLVLTEEGRRLADGVRQGLGEIERALSDLTRARHEGPLIVSVLPSFATRWLVPRLHRFARLHPGIQLQVLAEQALADLRSSRIHAALRFGGGLYPGLVTSMIMGDAVAPVCSPALFDAPRSMTVRDLAALPILHDTTTEGDGSGTDWASWLRFAGAADIRLPEGQRFNQADHVIDAAVSGLGVALARLSLVGADLAQRRLVRLPLPAMTTPYSYHLVCNAELKSNPKLIKFRDWLLNEAKAAENGVEQPKY
jgi:LysR family transcriptional regulator, glycine cleavage system transcriptional activator